MRSKNQQKNRKPKIPQTPARSGARRSPAARVLPPKEQVRLNKLIVIQGSETELHVEFCHLLAKADRSLQYQGLPDSALHDWLLSRYRRDYSPSWIRESLLIAEHVTPEQVKGKTFSRDALLNLCRTSPAYRLIVLAFPTVLTAEHIKLALRYAETLCGDAGAAKLREALEDPSILKQEPHGDGRRGRDHCGGSAAADTGADRCGRRLLTLVDDERRGIIKLEKLYDQGQRMNPELETKLGLAFTERDARSRRFEPLLCRDRRQTQRTPDPMTPEDPNQPDVIATGRPQAAAPTTTAPDRPQDDLPPEPERPERPGDHRQGSTPVSVPPDGVKVPVVRPALYTQAHVAVPVPFPSFAEPPTEADRVMGGIIVAFAQFGRLADVAKRLIDDGHEVSHRLQFHCQQGFQRCRAERSQIVPLIEDLADQGREELETWLAQAHQHDPKLQIEDGYALCTDPALAAALPAMDWVVYDSAPPFPIPDANHVEGLLMHMLGLGRYLRDAFARWHALYEQDVLHSHTLTFQLQQAILRFAGHTNQLLAWFFEGAQVGQQEEAQLGTLEVQRAAEREYAKRYIVTVGDLALPERYVIIGRLGDGRHVALSTARPHLVILIGNGNQGKTHLMRALCEGAVMGMPGLSQIGSEPSRGVDFCADWTGGQANHAALNGLFPNPNPAAHQRLRDIYGADTSNAAYRSIDLFCLPKTAPRFREAYPDLCERGLLPIEVVFNDAELTYFNLSVLASLTDARYKTRAAEWLDSLMAERGPELNLLKLIEKLEDSDLDSGSKGRMMRKLLPLLKMRSETEWMLDRMEQPGFKAVILESEWMPVDMLVPVQIAMMNAMSGVLRSGKDPHRLYGLDELLKFLAHPGMMRFLEMLGAELRVRPLTIMLAAQRARGIPKRLMALGSIFGTFYMSSPAEFKLHQGQVGGLGGLWYPDHVQTLKPGQMLLTAVESSDPRLVEVAQWVELRDTAIDPGGQTCRSQ